MTNGSAVSFPAWPKAYPELGCAAGFKESPDDFEVDETLAFVPGGSGQHLYLRLEKRAMETRRMAQDLADVYGVAAADVGYAGMKDKRAVTRQWFSVCTPSGADLASARGCQVLESSRHERKLRRGQLDGNTFRICLRGVSGAGWQERLDLVGTSGVPSYFGPQRFGGDNLARALDWLPRRRRRSISRFKQGLYLSVLRSYLFNEVLAGRVRDDSWSVLVSGDVTAGSVATGPLWGRGRSATADVAGELERAALAPHAAICADLEYAGVQQQRRALLLRPGNFSWELNGSDVLLRFDLPPGCYATSLLLEVFALDRARDCAAEEAQSR
jgi:tRNA pseudouridine13 synthase